MSHKGHLPPTLSNTKLTNNAPVTAHSPTPWQTSKPISRVPSRTSTPTNGFTKHSNGAARVTFDGEADSDDDVDEMDDRRPALHRPTDGRSHQPLLHKDDEERGRTGFASPDLPDRPPAFSRRSTMRSRSPDTQAKLATRKKYTYAAFFLGLSLVSFVVQTETAVYIQHDLHWNKAYCMLYFTHGSWSLLWPFQLLILRLQKWKMPWETFWRRHVYLVRTTAQMVETQSLDIPRNQHSPIPYMLRMTAFVTSALTVAGGSWYVAVNLTSPSDLTAIYNCSAFFAYAFSVPLLKEKLRLDKSFAVLVAIVGVLIVAYGDAAPTKHGGKSGGSVGGGTEETEASNRVAGNLIIGVGSVLYGFYEVLYKRLACPPEGTSPGRGMIFANTFGSLIGSFTLLVLWIPLPILHITGLEVFELPRGEAAWLLLVSVLANATFSGSFLVLISLTSPVLSSVAALLTIFLVAIVDWAWTGVPLSPAAIIGGLLIIAAFLMLTWSTYREMQEHRRKRQVDMVDSDSDKDDD
ncbi:Solute carrier family 35 member F5 [Hyphodiscus hymeniophilus]|uniref:Solute carrier family 35 member F5 n=1 Tax=Hyphodiscus hymeniophilus TaxID=353542 RepID=A0A9P7B0V5_9HELO|nr:Solute carrier family 35 member F5 [Hyphodiscus hymeniophilus]